MHYALHFRTFIFSHYFYRGLRTAIDVVGLLCSLITFIVSLSALNNLLLNVLLIVISFLTSMMGAFGNKTIPLQFAALLIMTLSMRNEFTAREALLHSGLIRSLSSP